MNEREDSGFTLVELLIAMALLGALTVLAYGAVQFGNLSWRHAGLRRDADADRTATRQLLGRSIRTAYPAFASAEYGDRRIVFDGQPEALELIAPLPEALTPGIMAVERFALSPGPDHSSLTLSWHVDLPSPTGGALPFQRVQVAHSVSVLHFAYFGRLNVDEAPGWSERWSGMDHLPDLIRVRVWRDGNIEAPWLDFSVATGTTTNTACVYDLESPNCRRLQ